MAEMYTHPQPLFCGSNEKEVLFKICSVLGTPTHDIWNDGIRQANIIGMKFPTCSGTDLERVIPEASTEAIDLMKQMIQWDPNKRATAKKLLKHPFFINHTIDNFYYSSGNNDVIFGENSCKKFSNSNEEEIRNGIKSNEKENNINNETGINGFELGDDDNFGNILNESDGFDKSIDQLKMEKIEEDRNYEKQKKQKVIEEEKENTKLKEEIYDIDKLIDKFNGENNNNFSKNDKNKKDLLNNDIFVNVGLYENKDFNLSKNENKKIKHPNNEIKSKQNRRGNARHFLEKTENVGGFNLFNGFNEDAKKKTNENIGSGDYNNLNIGGSEDFGSLFGNKSRRRHDKNYEI